MKRITLISLVLLLCTGLLWAQSDRGSITGTVKDATGAVIPNARVTATNVDTGVQTTATSNGLGLYTVLNLPIGKYNLAFSKEGFKSFERKGVTLGVGQVAEIDASLEIGAVGETITVTEEAPVLETQTSQTGTRIKGSVLSDLPLTVTGGRGLDTYALAAVPGVEGNGWETHIAGSAAFTKEVTIDGTSAVMQIGGHIAESSPSMEAIQEFQVETAGQRASDGRSGGGVYQYTLKSGTNSFHGSAFGFMHNEVLNANTWWNNFEGKERPVDRQFDYGFSAGGPIVKNKTFYFGAYERYQQERFVLAAPNATVPIPAFLNGDFGALLDRSEVLGTDAVGNTIYKGAIFDPANPGRVFVNNIIPTDRLSSVSQKVADIYRQQYAPTTPGLSLNNSRVRENDPWFHQDQITFKIDHNLSEKNRLSGSYIHTRRPRTLVDQGGIWAAGTQDGGPLAASRLHFVRTHAIRLSDSHTVSNNVLNVATVTFNRFYNPNTARSAESNDWPKALGFQNYGADNFPRITFGDGTNGVDIDDIGMALNNFYVSNVFIVNDNVTWVKGRHTIKFGGEFRAMQMNSHGDNGVLTFNFNKSHTGAPTTPYQDRVGFGFASFMLGAVDSASVSTGKQLYGRRKTLSLYVQDDFKVTDRLTLNLDLRWEFNGRYHEKNGSWANFNVDKINPTYGVPGVVEFAKDGSDSFEKNQYWTNFAPLVGAAYRLTDKLVVRGSLGLFYTPINLNYWSGVPYGFAPGYGVDNRVLSTTNFTPAFDWDSGYPGQAVPSVKDPNYTQWGMVSVDPRALDPGRTLQWNLGTQYELSKDMRLDVTYLGNRGYHLQSGTVRANQPNPAAFEALAKAGTIWNWVSDPASAAAAGVKYPYPGYSFFAWGAILPYPQVASTWGPIFYVGSPLGNSSYEALQINLSKRAARGLSTNVSYSISKAKGNVWSGWQETWWQGPLQNVYNLKEEADTVMPYDRTHIFKGYAAWDLPLGKGRALFSDAGRVLNAVVSGWTVSGTFRYESGQPLRVTGGEWYPGFSNVYADWDMRGDYNRKFEGGEFNPHAAAANSAVPANQYFNTSNFRKPEYGKLGNAPGYISKLRGFGGAYEDIGIMKYFYFGQDSRYSLQFRMEMLNAFNRHYFADPNTDINSPMFGQVTGIQSWSKPREGQIGIRFRW